MSMIVVVRDWVEEIVGLFEFFLMTFIKKWGMWHTFCTLYFFKEAVVVRKIAPQARPCMCKTLNIIHIYSPARE